MNVMGTMVLVEDNEDDVFLFRRVLDKAGIYNPLKILSDGEEAVNYLSGKGEFADREKHAIPFIVFLDLKLPILSGFEVLSWIRSRAELDSIIVVVLTSSAEEKDYQRAYAMGARSYLVKPPNAQSVLDIVNSLQTYWTALGQPEPFHLKETAHNLAVK